VRRAFRTPEELAPLLRDTIRAEFTHLCRMDAARACLRPKGPESWSPKEELGHLIDSAANNHMRIVRAGLDGSFEGPGYAQGEWVKAHDYQDAAWEFLVTLWQGYNELIAGVVHRLPRDRFSAPCRIGGGELLGLDFVIEDYIKHMQHHLDHLLGRATVTPYP
jgi:hypothetical protein